MSCWYTNDPDVSQHFQTSLKPLDQLNSNFMRRLIRMGEQVSSNGPGHMTKRAAMPIYGKIPLKNLLNKKAGDLGTCYIDLGCRAYKVCSNECPRLTLTYVKDEFAF